MVINKYVKDFMKYAVKEMRRGLLLFIIGTIFILTVFGVFEVIKWVN